MGFIEAVKSVYSRYVDFVGRSSRSEFWWFSLFFYVVGASLMLASGANSPNQEPSTALMILLGLFYLGTILPALAVTVRRLHDTDHKGWWIFISIVPVIGPILLIIWYCSKGTEGDNRFGPDPLA